MSIFPFINTGETVNQPNIQEELCEYAYSFKDNCLLKDKDGRNYFVYGLEALKVHVHKMLMTERYKHLSYSYDYGNEMYSLLGQTISKEVFLLEIKRYIVEALMYNEYIRELRDFTFTVEDSTVYITFTVVSIYGSFINNISMKGVTT